MYRIIGADGKEYGPITAEQVQKWIAEGRLNALSKIKAEDSSEWKTLADFPELMPPQAAAPAPMPVMAAPLGSTLVPPADQQVNGPAVALIILGVVEIGISLLNLFWNLAGGAVMNVGTPADSIYRMFSGTLGVAAAGFGTLLGVLIIFGAMKMKKLESYSLAVTASIISILPCSICCVVGVPIGIWALVVLSKPEIRSSFKG